MIARPTIYGLAAAWLVAVGWLLPGWPAARADVGGQVPGPDLCDYPGVGGSGMAMGAYTYWCDFPTEENGSHWHCEYGGAASQGNVGISMVFQASLTFPVGVLAGTCSFRCPPSEGAPAGLVAATPNPPGAWKEYLRPSTCKPLPLPEPPPGEPPPGTPGAAGGLLPPVTNPTPGNPEATQNEPRGNF